VFRSAAAGLMITAALLGAPSAGRAGSVSADSTWNEDNARQRAIQQVPRGATITGSECQTISVGQANFRYRCTVEYTTTPEPAPQPAN
jgi:hypothetical protein